jgi:putative transposase
MFSYPAEIRRAVYTTNTIESLNAALRKVTKNRSLFPNDEAVFKLLYPALRNISKRWTMPIKNWSGAMNQFAILFDGRVPMGASAQTHLHRSLRTSFI